MYVVHQTWSNSASDAVIADTWTAVLRLRQRDISDTTLPQQHRADAVCRTLTAAAGAVSTAGSATEEWHGVCRAWTSTLLAARGVFKDGPSIEAAAAQWMDAAAGGGRGPQPPGAAMMKQCLAATLARLLTSAVP